jgi:hypothetical protein
MPKVKFRRPKIRKIKLVRPQIKRIELVRPKVAQEMKREECEP